MLAIERATERRGDQPSQPGLVGAATARAEAHVVRLALIYALLDCSDTIGLEHLEAVLAVWHYSADSAAWIFGDSLGDPTADEIWAATKERPGGVTRTELSDMFSGNKKRREIERALTVLEAAGRLRRETRHPERGRAAEVWVPVRAAATSGSERTTSTAGDDIRPLVNRGVNRATRRVRRGLRPPFPYGAQISRTQGWP